MAVGSLHFCRGKAAKRGRHRNFVALFANGSYRTPRARSWSGTTGPTKSSVGGDRLAAIKGKRSRKKSPRHLTYFREVKGKIVERVEIDPDLNAITILFQDKTALSFDLEPRLTVFPELSDWKTGNWRGIKRGRAIHSKISMVSWP
jgi:hypothetical protein